MAQEASVIKLVNEILLEAINERASDIHIEPYENDLRIRYRIDGVLHNADVPPQIRRFQAAIISRIKIMANLNIAEKRLPAGRPHQDPASQAARSTSASASSRRSSAKASSCVSSTSGRCCSTLDAARHARRDTSHVFEAADRPAARHRPGHRPDRLRQDHHALRAL